VAWRGTRIRVLAGTRIDTATLAEGPARLAEAPRAS
jgi:hypothetical protein